MKPVRLGQVNADFAVSQTSRLHILHGFTDFASTYTSRLHKTKNSRPTNSHYKKFAPNKFYLCAYCGLHLKLYFRRQLYTCTNEILGTNERLGTSELLVQTISKQKRIQGTRAQTKFMHKRTLGTKDETDLNKPNKKTMKHLSPFPVVGLPRANCYLLLSIGRQVRAWLTRCPRGIASTRFLFRTCKVGCYLVGKSE